MAGYLAFTTGQVLTAAQVNTFLMEQSVMRFADDAARTTALSAVLAEGMLTYNEDTAALERYNGTAWVPAAPVIPGIGSNVASTAKTDTFTLSASTSTPFTNVTGMSVTITPSSATSKILVLLQASMSKSTAPMFYRLTGGNASDYVGDADGSRQRTISQIVTGTQDLQLGSAVYLDSPATTSPVTYQLQFRSGGQTSGVLHLNRASADDNNSNRGRGASSITAIEVSA